MLDLVQQVWHSHIFPDLDILGRLMLSQLARYQFLDSFQAAVPTD